jgi:hypothetical protein
MARMPDDAATKDLLNQAIRSYRAAVGITEPPPRPQVSRSRSEVLGDTEGEIILRGEKGQDLVRYLWRIVSGEPTLFHPAMGLAISIGTVPKQIDSGRRREYLEAEAAELGAEVARAFGTPVGVYYGDESVDDYGVYPHEVIDRIRAWIRERLLKDRFTTTSGRV